MKQILPVSLAAGLVAGLGGGFLAGHSLTPQSGEAAAAGLAPAGQVLSGDSLTPSGPNTAQLKRTIDDLSQRVTWLEQERSALERLVQRLEGETSTQEALAGEPGESLSELVAALERPNGPLPEPLRLSVEQAVADLRTAEQEERERALAEARALRLDQRMNELVQELSLTSAQTGLLREHLETYEQRRNEAREAAMELGDFGSMRDAMRTLRDESRANLETILDGSQIERFEELDGGGFGRGGGGGGGRRDRGGDRNERRDR